jgi:uroporphyrinogen-III synthase
VTSFVRMFGDRKRSRLLRGVPVAVIGPITARAARAEGFRVTLMPAAYTVSDLASVIVRRLRSSPSGTPRGS